jgi:thiamine pyrophosphate-dependent acetolactate synthase large subunit-like protein
LPGNALRPTSLKISKRGDFVQKNGARRVVETLEACGVTTIFGIPGIHNIAIYEALIESPIRHVTARHEQGAGFMADGWARSTGRTGTALVISGPGLTNILTPMAQAYHDSIPMVVISSQIPTSYIGQGAGFLHELENSTLMARSVSKESRRVESPGEIAPVLEAAYRLAASGRPGPVHVEIPMDILSMEAPPELKPCGAGKPTWVPAPRPEAVREAAEALEKARNPVMILGGGCKKAAKEALELAEALGAAVIESCAGKGVVDERHPLCLGARSHFPSVRAFLETADVILAVGTELAPTDLWEQPLPKKGILIQIDLDPANFGRNQTADIGIHADAADVLASLSRSLEGNVSSMGERTAKISEIRDKTKKELGALTGMGKDLPAMEELLSALRREIPEEGVLVADMTGPAYVAISEFPAYKPSTFLHPVGFGTLGLAVPAAIGAKIAAPETPVVALAGDGGFQFTMAEVAVACQEGISLPIVIWNDQGFGEIRRNEKSFGYPSLIAVDNPAPDFHALAASWGAAYARAATGREVAEALRQAFGQGRPTIIETAPKERTDRS